MISLNKTENKQLKGRAVLKAVNLLSVINSKKGLPQLIFELYLKNFSIEIKEDELNYLLKQCLEILHSSN